MERDAKKGAAGMKPPWGSRRSMAERWPALTLYQRFEYVVAFALTILVTFVIVVALFRLSVEIVGGLIFGALNPLEHRVFQAVFGEIMTVLIALEFNHTLRYVVAREQSVIQTKTVLLISLLALARRFIILDFTAATSTELLGLAAVTLALGGTYWLMRERDDRPLPTEAPQENRTQPRPIRDPDGSRRRAS